VEVRGTARPLELETRAGAPLDPEAVARDVRRIWNTGLFEDVQVEQSGAALVFRVVERRRTYLRRVESDPSDEKRRLRIERGAPMDAAAASAIASVLRRQLVEDGHREARVDATLIPAGAQEVDLRLKFDPGPRRVVREVRFSGSPVVSSDELSRELHATRVRRIIPGIWTSRPPLSDVAIESDAARLRSFYIGRGYFDAQVRAEPVEPAGKQAAVAFRVEPGPKYSGISFAPGQLCACLLNARRAAMQEGRLDFDAEVHAADAGLSAIVKTGPPYTVGRIEFRGNHSYSDATIRRAFVLNEGDLFDTARLWQSLARVDQLGLFEPVGADSVRIVRDPAARRADIIVSLKQRQPGRWSLSGPAGPVSIAGPLHGSIASRLPAWGRGVLEASTYSLSLSLVGFARPLSTLLPLTPAHSFVPIVALQRPYLPGQIWQSGFVVAPQLKLKGMAVSYATAHLHHGARLALGAGAVTLPVPAIPFVHGAETGAAFPCEEPKPRWRTLRFAGTYAADFLLGSRLF
jgi:outer membrane protein insertion porin family